MMSQISPEWDPHKVLEYFKVAIRTTTAEIIGKNRKDIRDEISNLKEDINEMNSIKIMKCNL